MSGIILVIGGNAAGPAAAAKAKRAAPEAEVILIEKSNFISTGTCELPFLISGEIDNYNKLVFYSPEKFFTEKGVTVKCLHIVRELNTKNKNAVIENLENGSLYTQKYDRLILATGSVSRKIQSLDYSLENVFTFKSITDYLKIYKYLSDNKVKEISIIGAGYIGIELAEAFTQKDFNVTLIDREDLPFSFASGEVQNIVSEVLKNNKIRFIGGVKDLRPFSSGNSLKSINCDGRIIETDILISSVGFMPNTSLSENAKIRIGDLGGIITDSRLRTSDFSVFAAGDCSEVTNFVTNKKDYIPSASIAHIHGHLAGQNAAGANKAAEKVIKNLSVRVFNSFYAQVGITEKEALENNFIFSSVFEVMPNLVKVMPNSRSVFGKIIFEKRNKTILGAAFFGGSEVSGYADIISLFIRNKIPATILSLNNYNYTPALSPFVNILSVLGRKIY